MIFGLNSKRIFDVTLKCNVLTLLRSCLSGNSLIGDLLGKLKSKVLLQYQGMFLWLIRTSINNHTAKIMLQIMRFITTFKLAPFT